MKGLSLLLVLGACATTPPLPPVPPEPTPVQTASPPPLDEPTCRAFARPGVLRRSSVGQVVDAGLGRWLAAVEVDPGVAQGHFRGWVVRSLYPGDPCYRDVDLRAGDLVLKVNGKSIERPEQASDVFSSLRTAPALVVDFVRDGQPHTLTLPIADE
jgi:S1-C subfamily serine protease